MTEAVWMTKDETHWGCVLLFVSVQGRGTEMVGKTRRHREQFGLKDFCLKERWCEGGRGKAQRFVCSVHISCCPWALFCFITPLTWTGCSLDSHKDMSVLSLKTAWARLCLAPPFTSHRHFPHQLSSPWKLDLKMGLVIYKGIWKEVTLFSVIFCNNKIDSK